MSDNNLFDANSDINKEIIIENLNLNNSLDKILIEEINQSGDLKSDKPALQYEPNKYSLILQESNRHEFVEKIKKDQVYSTHSRINDFKQKHFSKFPQIYNLKHSIIFDRTRNIFENKSEIISKYIFNPYTDIELDIGGSLNMRNNLAISGFFSSLRFYNFEKKLLNNFFYSFGEKQNFSYEGNYLIDKNFMIDYVYKKKGLLNESWHKISMYKSYNGNGSNFSSQSHFKAGLKYFYFKNFENDVELNLFWKKHFSNKKNKSFEGGIKLSFNEIKLAGKLKENFCKNFYSITEHKLNAGQFFNYSTSNKIIYNYKNNYLKFGYFQNIDGIGIEFGYSKCGLEISFPIVFFRGDLNFDKILNQSFLNNFYNFSQQSLIFFLLHYSYIYLVKRLKLFLKNRKEKLFIKNEENIASENNFSKNNAALKEILEQKISQEKIISQILPQAEKIHKAELEKGKFGLIINYAIYGSRDTIKKILNTIVLIPKENLYKCLEEIILDAQNEVVNVTTPVRYMIKSEEKNNFSSILFHQVPKTKILGFVNPIFKSKKEPCILINFRIGGGVYTLVRKDHEIFQIPENLNINS